MRNGKILIENSPNSILETFNTHNLDDCFLLISQQQENDGHFDDIQNSEVPNLDDEINCEQQNQKKCIFSFTSKIRMQALIMKNYLFFIRSKLYIFNHI